MEAGEIDIAAIHDVEGAGLGDQFVEHPGIVPSGGGDVYEGGDVAAQIQERMELDSSFAALERGPGEERQTEIDGGGVEPIDGVREIDAEAVLDVQAPGGGDRGLGEVGVNAPVAFLVGIGERGARDTPPGCPYGRAWSIGRANRPRCRAGSRDG